jgi:hypothetical protein
MAVYKLNQTQLRSVGAYWGTIPVATLEDVTLSAPAHRLLMWMLAKPATWDFNIDHVARTFKVNRSTISRQLRELVGAKYVERYQMHVPQHGIWEWSYTVYPLPLPQMRSIQKSAPSKKSTGIDANVIQFPEQAEA